jgi:3-methyladenine DNA glycosylase AlkD
LTAPAAARVEAVRAGLAAAADPAKAPAMQAYMRSAMPFHGVQSAPLRAVLATVMDDHPFAGRADWEATLDALWEDARFREERYAAARLAGHRSARSWQDMVVVPRYDRWVVTGGWWDHVDDVAIHRIGPILRSHRAALTPTVRSWIGDPDRWRRRVSIICQVGAKAETDLDLLGDAIVANVADRDFFIRKAIGWALREHGKTDPEWVRRFVAVNEGELSPLSYREATRHL